MTYLELIAKALNGRTVNKAAQDWGIPQKTLDRYAKGERMPDYQTALKIAREAGIDPGTVMQIFAAEEALKKPRGLFAEFGYAAATILISVNLFLTPIPSEAAPVLKGNSGAIYLMLNTMAELAAVFASAVVSPLM